MFRKGPKVDKKPTIKTIAKLAGVSHVTVSRALRGYPDISAATTEKIRTIAQEIGYTPNAFARSLSTKRASSIGMIVPSMGADTIYNEVFQSVSRAAAEQGLSVLLGSCDRSIELEASFSRLMCENRVGAIIVASVSSDVSHIKRICEGLVPIIFTGGKTIDEEENCIAADYRHSGRIAVEHLYELGHRDIAFFVYHPDNQTIAQKTEGYKEAMEAHGLIPTVYWEGDSSDTFSAGKSLTERLISEKKLPTAIWCASDLMAMGVLDALKVHNIFVPAQISVMGHDDLFLGRMSFISLTTIALPKEEIGRESVRMAISLMGEGEQILPQKMIFQTRLITRGSTGPLADSL